MLKKQILMYFPFLFNTFFKSSLFSIIGKKALVIKDIDPIHSSGQIKLNGEVWSAETENDEIIKEGSEVEVLKINGVKAIVKLVESEKVESKI